MDFVLAGVFGLLLMCSEDERVEGLCFDYCLLCGTLMLVLAVADEHLRALGS